MLRASGARFVATTNKYLKTTGTLPLSTLLIYAEAKECTFDTFNSSLAVSTRRVPDVRNFNSDVWYLTATLKFLPSGNQRHLPKLCKGICLCGSYKIVSVFCVRKMRPASSASVHVAVW